MDSLALHKILSAILLPPVSPALVMVLGAVIGRTLPRTGGVLFLLGFAATVGLALPMVEQSLQAQFEERFHPVTAATPMEHEQAIVILGAGRVIGSQEYQGDTLSALTLQHVRYGARLARQTSLPVLVSGGKPTGGKTSEAELMADALTNEFGVAVRWREPSSDDTAENAANTAAILKPLGVTHILLVTDVVHMSRARVDFEAQGFEVRPAPTGFSGVHPFYWTDIIPSPNAYAGSARVLHEWLGLAWEGLFQSHTPERVAQKRSASNSGADSAPAEGSAEATEKKI